MEAYLDSIADTTYFDQVYAIQGDCLCIMICFINVLSFFAVLSVCLISLTQFEYLSF